MNADTNGNYPVKKKRRLIAVLFAILLLGAACFLISRGLTKTEAIYLKASDGRHLILVDQTPIQIRGNGDRYAKYQTGDILSVIHGSVAETYPASASVYFASLKSDGSAGDVSSYIVERLTSLGIYLLDEEGYTREIYTGIATDWSVLDDGTMQIGIDCGGEGLSFTADSSARITSIQGLEAGEQVTLTCRRIPGQDPQVTDLIEMQTVSVSHKYSNIQIMLPAGWKYTLQRYNEDKDSYGIYFCPEDTRGKIRLEHYPDGFHAEEKMYQTQDYRLGNGQSVRIYTREGDSRWEYMEFTELSGSYVLKVERDILWWDDYRDEVMQIMESAILAKGTMSYEEAYRILETVDLPPAMAPIDYDYDSCNGRWRFVFDDDPSDGMAQYYIYVCHDGSTEIVNVPLLAGAFKPVIYLYPEHEQRIRVTLDYDGTLTSTYPQYREGWDVIAQPDGTLTDPKTGREYYCLFWEGISDTVYDFSEGFVVAGADTQAFLESALAQMGLTDKEANEFIIYWLPQMENNAYNLISFQQEAYTDSAKLTVEPAPDSVLRIFMAWKALDEPVDIEPQEFVPFEREGFAVIEWGGAEIK